MNSSDTVHEEDEFEDQVEGKKCLCGSEKFYLKVQYGTKLDPHDRILFQCAGCGNYVLSVFEDNLSPLSLTLFKRALRKKGFK